MMMPIQAKDDADSVGDMFSRHVPFFHFGLGFGEIKKSFVVHVWS